MDQIARSQEEIDAQLNLADDAMDKGLYPGMNAGEAVGQFWRWVTGVSSDPPFGGD